MMLQDMRLFDVREDQVKWVQEGVEWVQEGVKGVQEGVEGVQEGVQWVQEGVEWVQEGVELNGNSMKQVNSILKSWRNQFNDAMTEKSSICCSIRGEQMIYIELACQSGGHRVVGKLSFEYLLAHKWCYKI